MLVSSTNAERWKVFGANNNSLSEKDFGKCQNHISVFDVTVMSLANWAK